MTDPWYLKKGILIVDDEPFMRSIVADLLRDIGFRAIEEANDGEKGLELLKSKGSMVDLVILDLEMPVLDGIDTLAQIRSATDNRTATIPVIVVTGHSELITVTETVELGIHGYLVKPVSRTKLQMAMKNGFEGAPIDPKSFKENIASHDLEYPRTKDPSEP